MCQKFPFVVQCKTRYKQKYANRDPERKPSENVNTLQEAFPIMTPSLFGTDQILLTDTLNMWSKVNLFQMRTQKFDFVLQLKWTR